MLTRRSSAVLLATAIAMSGCSSFGTSDPSCGYSAFVAGMTFQLIDEVTQQPPTSTPLISATASNGQVVKSQGETISGDSADVNVFVGPGTYTVTITTTGYKVVNVGLLTVPPSSDLSCAGPNTIYEQVTLTPLGAGSSRRRASGGAR